MVYIVITFPVKHLLILDIKFCFQEEFTGMIEDAGFSHVTYENLSFGIAAIHSGFKL